MQGYKAVLVADVIAAAPKPKQIGNPVFFKLARLVPAIVYHPLYLFVLLLRILKSAQHIIGFRPALYVATAYIAMHAG